MARDASTLDESIVKQLLRSVVQEELKPLNGELQQVRAELHENRDEIKQMRKEMLAYRDEVATIKDEIVSELETTRQELVIDKSVHRRVINLEDDVEQLKKIHHVGRTLPNLRALFFPVQEIRKQSCDILPVSIHRASLDSPEFRESSAC